MYWFNGENNCLYIKKNTQQYGIPAGVANLIALFPGS